MKHNELKLNNFSFQHAAVDAISEKGEEDCLSSDDEDDDDEKRRVSKLRGLGSAPF